MVLQTFETGAFSLYREKTLPFRLLYLNQDLSLSSSEEWTRDLPLHVAWPTKLVAPEGMLANVQ